MGAMLVFSVAAAADIPVSSWIFASFVVASSQLPLACLCAIKLARPAPHCSIVLGGRRFAVASVAKAASLGQPIRSPQPNVAAG